MDHWLRHPVVEGFSKWERDDRIDRFLEETHSVNTYGFFFHTHDSRIRVGIFPRFILNFLVYTNGFSGKYMGEPERDPWIVSHDTHMFFWPDNKSVV